MVLTFTDLQNYMKACIILLSEGAVFRGYQTDDNTFEIKLTGY